MSQTATDIVKKNLEKKVLDRDAIYLYPKRLSTLCKMIAHYFWSETRKNGGIDVVVGPPVVASWVAYWLTDYFSKDGSGQNVLCVNVDQDVSCRQRINHKYRPHIRKRRCLIVNDLVDSGSCIIETRLLLEDMGAEVCGAGVICNESSGRVSAEFLGVNKLFSSVNLNR